jgi:hypothetical protein
MSEPQIIRRRTLAWLLGVGVFCFVAALVMIFFGESLLPVRTAEANAFSRSAIGHQAFVEMLKRLNHPVVVSRSDTFDKAGPADLIIIAEPAPFIYESDYLERLLDGSRVLLVLPKWQATPKFGNARWAGEVSMIPDEFVEEVLHLVDDSASLVRGKKPSSWQDAGVGAAPTIAEPQLIRSTVLTPIVHGAEGILLGELTVGSDKLLVLSDPDPLSNHGLDDGANAEFIAAALDRLVAPQSTILFDETIHGFRRSPNLALAAVEYPFVFATINAVAALVFLAWSAAVRFGSPSLPPPPIKAGKISLIDNAAGLLIFGGHAREVVGRYMDAVTAGVATRLHLRAGADPAETTARLDGIGSNRKVTISFGKLRNDALNVMARAGVDEQGLLLTARRLHRWKEEMLNGSRRDQGR